MRERTFSRSQQAVSRGLAVSRMSRIHGIPVEIGSRPLRRNIRRVLDQIKVRCPKDFERIQRLVKRFRWLSEREDDGKTSGEWCSIPTPPEDLLYTDRAAYAAWFDNPPGDVGLAKRLAEDRHVATIAHELGHACTRVEDLDRRGEHPSDEWTSELCADWYAYKWGFGRQIAQSRKSRNLMRHPGAPGSTVDRYINDYRYSYKLSRNFVLKLVEKVLQ